jgi:hypothetical protein
LSNSEAQTPPTPLGLRPQGRGSGLDAGSLRRGMAKQVACNVIFTGTQAVDTPCCVSVLLFSLRSSLQPERRSTKECSFRFRPFPKCVSIDTPPSTLVPGEQSCRFLSGPLSLSRLSRFRVDMTSCFPYTYAVVLRPLGLVVIGKSFVPRNTERRNGAGKSGRNGAPAPQSRVASPLSADAVHSLG